MRWARCLCPSSGAPHTCAPDCPLAAVAQSVMRCAFARLHAACSAFNCLLVLRSVGHVLW